MRPYPPDGGLKKQVRPFGETFSVLTVIKEEFFPGLLTDEEKRRLGPERSAAAVLRAGR